MSSSYPLIISKKHLVEGSKNTYKYDFSSNIDFSNIDIGLGSANIWFSWRNISESKQNNRFTIIHPTSTGTVDISLIIPDGGYNIVDINNFIKFTLISQGYYIQNTITNEQIVYCELKVNPSIYAIEFVSYQLPTALPANHTAGSSITFNAVSTGPQLSITQPYFGKVIGFEVGVHPVVAPTTLTTIQSTNVPSVSDVNTIIITLDSAMNPFAPNSRVIHAISPAGHDYASLIKSEPNEISWIPQQSGYRQSITLQLLNQDLVALDQYDTDITIKLLLRIKDNNCNR